MRLPTIPILLLLALLTLTVTAQDLPDRVPSPTPIPRAERCYNRCLAKRLVNCPDPEIYTHEFCMCRNNYKRECRTKCGLPGQRPDMCRPNMSTMTPDPEPTEELTEKKK